MGEQTANALIVIDVQQGFDDQSWWGPRNNPECEENILALLKHWREKGWPVVLVKHTSKTPGSPLGPGQPGNEFKPGVDGPHDLLVSKQVNSAFYGTPDLHEWLQAENINAVTICGIVTNFCCETTARMAGNLGYDVSFVLDATHSFDRADVDGQIIPAAEMYRTTAANLNREFATIVATHDLVG